MPNGSVPLHMVIRPKGSDTSVLYCQGANVRVVPKDEWEKHSVQAASSLILNAAGARVLERFLRYWLQDHGDGPIYRPPGVDVDYDF
jgi:hypothetical protein